MKAPPENSGAERKKRVMPKGRPFKKGQSGNPGGRPKEAKEIRDLLALGAEKMVAAIMAAVDRGEAPVALKGLEFIIGKAAQSVTVSGDVEKPLRVIFETGKEDRK